MKQTDEAWRVCYLVNGGSQYTGKFYLRANTLKILPSMRASSDRGKTAWIEYSPDNGRTWTTED